MLTTTKTQKKTFVVLTPGPAVPNNNPRKKEESTIGRRVWESERREPEKRIQPSSAFICRNIQKTLPPAKLIIIFCLSHEGLHFVALTFSTYFCTQIHTYIHIYLYDFLFCMNVSVCVCVCARLFFVFWGNTGSNAYEMPRGPHKILLKTLCLATAWILMKITQRQGY